MGAGQRMATFVAVLGITLSSVCQGQLFGQNLANIPGNTNNNNNNNRQNVNNRQGGLGGLSFAIPGLSLLAGNNGVGGGGNIFGVATVTRTIVSTVSTVTTASFRTCVLPTAALTACMVGRRRRDVEGLEDMEEAMEEIKPTTPGYALVVGTTTLRDPEAVTEYLDAHKLSGQSVIYPPGVEEMQGKINPRLEVGVEEEGMEGMMTTALYPSQDNPEILEEDDKMMGGVEIEGGVTTTTSETPELISGDDGGEGALITTTTEDNLVEDGTDDKARVGLGRTTTVTTVIRVTSVATSLATGAMATLQIMYTGCLPPQLPISGPAC